MPLTYAIAGLRMNKAHVTHPELKCTFCLEIIGVKKNPNGQTYTTLGVITKGTIIEVGFCAVIPCQHRLSKNGSSFVLLWGGQPHRGWTPSLDSWGAKRWASGLPFIGVCTPSRSGNLTPNAGECQRAGTGDAWRQGGVGQVRPGATRDRVCETCMLVGCFRIP